MGLLWPLYRGRGAEGSEQDEKSMSIQLVLASGILLLGGGEAEGSERSAGSGCMIYTKQVF